MGDDDFRGEEEDFDPKKAAAEEDDDLFADSDLPDLGGDTLDEADDEGDADLDGLGDEE